MYILGRPERKTKGKGAGGGGKLRPFYSGSDQSLGMERYGVPVDLQNCAG